MVDWSKKESEVLQRKVRHLLGGVGVRSASAGVQGNTSTPELGFWGQIENYRREILAIITFVLRNLNITFSLGRA